MVKREREGERETERQRETERDRETERETERQSILQLNNFKWYEDFCIEVVCIGIYYTV